MSRYIEQERIGKTISNLPTEVFQTEDRIELVLSATEAINAIKDAPSIDICFCRECKYFWKYSDLPTKCVFHLSLVNADDFCSYGSRSEKPNCSTTEDCSTVRCERIHEDGVYCARYPACDDCPDNPLNKVKGSERLVKGSEKPNNSND